MVTVNQEMFMDTAIVPSAPQLQHQVCFNFDDTSQPAAGQARAMSATMPPLPSYTTFVMPEYRDDPGEEQGHGGRWSK